MQAEYAFVILESPFKSTRILVGNWLFCIQQRSALIINVVIFIKVKESQIACGFTVDPKLLKFDLQFSSSPGHDNQ